MVIYTKTGDYGETSFVTGERVRKDDIRIETYGTLDELNSLIGVVLTFVTRKETKEILEKIQHDLFTLGAELASISFKKEVHVPKVTPQHVADLERAIDLVEPQLKVQTSFLLPNGTQAACFLNLARTIARRAERRLVTLIDQFPVNVQIIRYLNRLSDLLYVLARYENKEIEEKEQQPIYKYFE
jgi:cob(I)alamin adenosyltransferase